MLTDDERQAVHAFCVNHVAEPALRPFVARWMLREEQRGDATVAAFVFTRDPDLREVRLHGTAEEPHTDFIV